MLADGAGCDQDGIEPPATSVPPSEAARKAPHAAQRDEPRRGKVNAGCEAEDSSTASREFTRQRVDREIMCGTNSKPLHTLDVQGVVAALLVPRPRRQAARSVQRLRCPQPYGRRIRRVVG